MVFGTWDRKEEEEMKKKTAHDAQEFFSSNHSRSLLPNPKTFGFGWPLSLVMGRDETLFPPRRGGAFLLKKMPENSARDEISQPDVRSLISPRLILKVEILQITPAELAYRVLVANYEIVVSCCCWPLKTHLHEHVC